MVAARRRGAGGGGPGGVLRATGRAASSAARRFDGALILPRTRAVHSFAHALPARRRVPRSPTLVVLATRAAPRVAARSAPPAGPLRARVPRPGHSTVGACASGTRSSSVPPAERPAPGAGRSCSWPRRSATWATSRPAPSKPSPRPTSSAARTPAGRGRCSERGRRRRGGGASCRSTQHNEAARVARGARLGGRAARRSPWCPTPARRASRIPARAWWPRRPPPACRSASCRVPRPSSPRSCVSGLADRALLRRGVPAAQAGAERRRPPRCDRSRGAHHGAAGGARTAWRRTAR